MFGKNPIRKQQLDPKGALFVQELFPTIQGEGPFAGMPAVFLRLWGCNLRCWFCDTDFESNREEHSARALAERVKEMANSASFCSDLLVITGGEPLLQNIVPLLDALDPSMRIQIETAGTVWVPGLEAHIAPHGELHLVCSPKTGRVAKEIEERCWDFKYIVSASGMPIDYGKGIPRQATQSRDTAATVGHDLYYPSNPAATIWLQPCDEQSAALNEQNRKLCAELAMAHGHRVSLQQHKILNIP